MRPDVCLSRDPRGEFIGEKRGPEQRVPGEPRTVIKKKKQIVI